MSFTVAAKLISLEEAKQVKLKLLQELRPLFQEASEDLRHLLNEMSKDIEAVLDRTQETLVLFTDLLNHSSTRIFALYHRHWCNPQLPGRFRLVLRETHPTSSILSASTAFRR